MFQHPVTEHLPQDIAAELCQRGVDEQVLLFQRLRQGATRSRIRLLHSCVFHEPGNDLQRIDSLVQLGSGLFSFSWVWFPNTTCPVFCVFPKSIQ